MCLLRVRERQPSLEQRSFLKMASAHDRKVINSILNPTLPLGEGVHDDVEEDAKDLRDPEEEDTEEIR